MAAADTGDISMDLCKVSFRSKVEKSLWSALRSGPAFLVLEMV